jgi:hypothetical protein
MPGLVQSEFFYLDRILEIFSRKIVGRVVHERESANLAAEFVRKAVWVEGCLTPRLSCTPTTAARRRTPL